MEKFDFEVSGMGMNTSGYPGAFTSPVQKIIKEVLYGRVLHLYSGSSLIGNERIDLEHPNATRHYRVEEFIEQNEEDWDWVLLDPPYAIRSLKKLEGYGEKSSLSSNVKWRNQVRNYMSKHTQNILWLDFCAPMVSGFVRKKLWLLLPGGFHTVRILSWLTKGETP